VVEAAVLLDRLVRVRVRVRVRVSSTA